MEEKQIETQILTWLNLQQQTFAFKINTVGVFDPIKKVFRKNKNQFIIPGTSDIVGSMKGRFFAIEVKSSRGYARFMNTPTLRDQLQMAFLAKVQRSGGLTLVACCLEQVMTWYKRFDTCPL
jgi:penicillin-binding protein-related factor A (putative recombinase)